MFKKKTIGTFILGMIMTLTFVSCGSSSKTVKDYKATTNLSGLVEDNSQDPTILYIRPNAPSLAEYNSFIIGSITLDPRDKTAKKLKPKDLTRILTNFRENLTKELKKSGYTVTDSPGEKTMEISFVLSGLKATKAAANTLSVLLPVALSVGGVTVEGTFRESVSNRIDAVAIARSEGSRVLNTSPWSKWADVESSLNKWAKGIAESIDKAHGK